MSGVGLEITRAGKRVKDRFSNSGKEESFYFSYSSYYNNNE